MFSCEREGKRSEHVVVLHKTFPNAGAFYDCTGIGKSTNPRFCENEDKMLRSSACCKQENAICSPLIHQTWPEPFSGARTSFEQFPPSEQSKKVSEEKSRKSSD